MSEIDPLDEWRTRTASTIRVLADAWQTLAAHTAAGGGGGGDASGVRAPSTEAALPINVHVIDLRDEVTKSVRRFVPLVRGTLRMGVEPMKTTTTPGLLKFVAGAFVDLHRTDPTVGEDVAAEMWGFVRRANRVLTGVDTSMRPFRLEACCPTCGLPSMWADPRSWRSKCGMPGCDYEEVLDQPLVHSTATDK